MLIEMALNILAPVDRESAACKLRDVVERCCGDLAQQAMAPGLAQWRRDMRSLADRAGELSASLDAMSSNPWYSEALDPNGLLPRKTARPNLAGCIEHLEVIIEAAETAIEAAERRYDLGCGGRRDASIFAPLSPRHRLVREAAQIWLEHNGTLSTSECSPFCEFVDLLAMAAQAGPIARTIKNANLPKISEVSSYRQAVQSAQ